MRDGAPCKRVSELRARLSSRANEKRVPVGMAPAAEPMLMIAPRLRSSCSQRPQSARSGADESTRGRDKGREGAHHAGEDHAGHLVEGADVDVDEAVDERIVDLVQVRRMVVADADVVDLWPVSMAWTEWTKRTEWTKWTE